MTFEAFTLWLNDHVGSTFDPCCSQDRLGFTGHPGQKEAPSI